MQHRFWKGFLVLGVVLEIIVLVVTGRQTLYPQVVKAQQYAQSQPQLKGKTYLPVQSVIFVAAERNIRIAVFRYHGRIYINAYHIADQSMRTILQITRSFISSHTLKISLSTHILLL